MNQPTDRMLIDALCICVATSSGRLDVIREAHANQATGNDGAALHAKAQEIVGAYAKIAFARIMREQAERADLSDDIMTTSPEDTPDANELVARHAAAGNKFAQRLIGASYVTREELLAFVRGDSTFEVTQAHRDLAAAIIDQHYEFLGVDSPELTDDQLARLKPARRPTTVADITPNVRSKCVLNPDDFRVVGEDGQLRALSSDERDQLFGKHLKLERLRRPLHLLRPEAEMRVGSLEIGTSRVRVAMERQDDGSYRGRVSVDYGREVEPNRGLSDQEVEFLRALEEAHHEGVSLSIEIDGRLYTGVRITDIVKQAPA